MGGGFSLAGAGGVGGAGGLGGGTAGIGPGGQSGYYTPNPQAVAAAQEQLTHLNAEIQNAEDRRAHLKANASQDQKDRLDEEIRHLNAERDEAEGRLQKAQQGTFHAGRGGRGGTGGSMLATPLPENFGLGKGLPGMAEWLVDWIGDMAMAPWAAVARHGRWRRWWW